MYFDFEHTVRTNGAFRDKLHKLTARLEVLGKRAISSQEAQEQANMVLLDILRHCKYHTGFLLPYYFPQYPKNVAMSLQDFPYAYHLLPLTIGGFTVVRGSRQIAKSTTFAARQRLNAHIFPRFKSMYIAPKSDQMRTYANKLRELEYAFKYYATNTRFRQNLLLKEYANGSTIELFNVDTQVTNIRGKSSDELLFDEYQNFDPEFEPEVSEVQSASVMPVTMYAGTSLTTDTALEAKYEDSSQGVWVMRCEGCGIDNIPLPEEGVMDMIQPKGVSCKKCDHALNVRTGHFVHQNKQAFDLGKIGFHIPQIIVPFVVQNKIRYSEIYRKKLEWDPRKFFQENLGIPTEEGEREITEQDLKEICSLGDQTPLRQKAENRQYRFVVSGCDWGGSDYDVSLKTKVSYTVHTMLGQNLDKTFDIIHMKRYEGMSYRNIADDIMYWHDKLNGNALGADFGVGMAYNMLLREKMDPSKHLIFNYTGPNTVPAKESKIQFNQFSLNKTDSITSLYYAVKNQRLKCYNWSKAKEYLKDFLNLYRTPSDMPGGANTFVYRRHGAKADDTLHAINFAYVVARLYLQEPLVEDISVLRRIERSLRPGHIDTLDQKLPQAFSM